MFWTAPADELDATMLPDQSNARPARYVRAVGNRIEPATTSRSKCVTCNQVIDKGTPRMAEEYSDIGIPKLIMRFYHLRCAAAAHPELLRRALEDVRPGCELDRAELEARIAARLQHEEDRLRERYEARQAERAASRPVVATDDTTGQLIDQLADDPDDPGTLAVVADQLQARGDPRGELIAVQLALAAQGKRRTRAAAGDEDDEDDADEQVDLEALARRREVLMQQLGLPAPLDQRDGLTWGIGFVRRLELIDKTPDRLEELAEIWSHPSLRVLSELKVTFASARDTYAIARLAERVPPTLRALEVGRWRDHSIAELPKLLAVLPRLRSLVLHGQLGQARIVHPRLQRLALPPGTKLGDTAAMMAALSPRDLPALTELSITGFSERVWPEGWTGDARTARIRRADDYDPVCASLVPWLPRLTHLALIDGTLSEVGLAALARGLAGRKLRRLDLTATPMPIAARVQLMKLCEELIFPDAIVADDAQLWVEHANKPEWGRGRIVRRFDGKLEVEFPGVGSKVFRADAPFLRLGS